MLKSWLWNRPQIVCLIEIPSYFITNYIMDKFGRKKTLFVGMIGSGIFCILSEFIYGDLLKTIFFVLGKMTITISFSCLYIFTIELFPTNLRHRFFSICSVVGRVGSILTPLTPILAQQISPSLPLILFAALAFSSAIWLCTLPETLNRKLPETVEDAFSWLIKVEILFNVTRYQLFIKSLCMLYMCELIHVV